MAKVILLEFTLVDRKHFHFFTKRAQFRLVTLFFNEINFSFGGKKSTDQRFTMKLAPTKEWLPVLCVPASIQMLIKRKSRRHVLLTEKVKEAIIR